MSKSDHGKIAVANNAVPAPMKRFRTQMCWILFLTLSVNACASADYRTSYGKGLEAFENENWSEAAGWLQEAIEENPEGGKKIRIPGQRKKICYAPYYHLGLALYHADELKKASKALRTSMHEGAARKDLVMQQRIIRLRNEINERLDQENQLELPADTLQWVEEELVRAEQSLSKLDEPDLRAVVTAIPSLSERRREGVRKLRLARQICEGGDKKALKDAHALAVEAAGILEDIVLEATRLAREQSY